MLKGFIARWYEGDVSASATTTSAGSPTSAGDGKNTESATGGTTASQTSGDQEKPKDEPKFTQAQLDEAIKARLAEEQRRAEKKTADATRQAEQAVLAQNAEWEKLAKTRETEISTLKTKAELADELASSANESIDSEVAKWPDELKALDPGKDRLLERLKWIKQMRPVAAKLTPATPTSPNNEAGKGNSRPAGKPNGDAGGNQQQSTYRFQSPHDVKW